MSKLKSKPRSGGSSAKPPRESSRQPTKPGPKEQSGLVETLRTEIQSLLPAPDSKAVKENAKKGKIKHSGMSEDKTQTKTSGPARGKKRARNGDVVSHGPEEAAPAEDGEEDVLQREMKDLGGTAEDIALLADAESDSEVEGTASDPPSTPALGRRNGGSLEKGMKNILKEIALAQGEVEEDEDEKPLPPKQADRNQQPPATREKPQPSAPDQKPEKAQRGRKAHQLLCEPRPDWFLHPEPDVDMQDPPGKALPKDLLDQLFEHAKYLLDEDNQRFKESQQSSSAQSFYNTVIASGTLSDKISALTLAVQESPIHNVRALETLIALAGKRSRSQAVDVLRALKDLFAQGSLLPESRKLYAFQAQPALPYLFAKTRSWRAGDGLPRGLDQTHLISWAFEHWLKEQYFEVLKILEVWCNDEIEFSKARAVSYVYELLKEKPEQESNLLRLLINKLGDPVKKIASQASYSLMQLLIAHPAMKSVVVTAIEADFIFRPGQSLHGRYYAVVTLNQTELSTREEEVALKLLDIYFGLFTSLLKPDNTDAAKEQEVKDDREDAGRFRRRKQNRKPIVPVQSQAEELRDKLVSAVLTGVNRAYPYAGSNGTSFSDHLATLFKVTHSANFNTSIQAMMLIQQLSTTHKGSNDRFYRVLYESMLDPRLIIASKQQLYLNLLHRSLKADLNAKRVKAFVKRLVQILSLHEPSFICGAFFLIRDLEKTMPSLVGLVDDPEDHDDDGVEVFRDVDEDAEAPPAPEDAAAAAGGKPQGSHYDAHKRAPEHANADNSCLWELLPFLAHFHPSVSVSADHVLRHQGLPGKPDLKLHTLSHFLDRFVYRNPKLADSGLRGSSLMQPMAATDTQGVLISGAPDAKRIVPVNSEAFRTKKTEDVAAEDVFFHRYFNSLGKGGKKKESEKKKKRRAGDGEDSDGDDTDEDEVWKAMMDSAPELEGGDFDDDDDDDLDLADLDSDAGSDEVSDDGADGGVDIDPDFFDDDDEDVMDVDGADAGEAAMDEADGSSSDVSDFAGFDAELADTQQPAKKAKKAHGDAQPGKKNSSREDRKRLKNLPTFAAAADYAKMLEDDEDEDY